MMIAGSIMWDSKISADSLVKMETTKKQKQIQLENSIQQNMLC